MKRMIQYFKEIALVALLLYATNAFTQTQKIHTLQITDGTTTETMSTDALLQLDAKGKGLLLPRVALTDAKKPAPLAAHTVGMIVYNTATVSSTATVEGVNPGYYYNNGTKWVRLTDTSDQEWVYAPTSKQVNLKRSGTAPFTNKVYYDEKGLLKNYTDETYEYWDRVTKTYKISSSAAKLSSNYLQRNSQSLAPTLNSTVKSKYLNNSILIADETTSDAWSLYNGVSSVMIKKDNVANYRDLTAFGMGASHQGKGDVKYLIGGASWASLFNGAKSSGYLVGLRSGVNLFNNSTANEISGIRTYNVDWGNGTINSLEGAHHFLSFEQNSSSTISNILGVTVHPIAHSNSGSQITNVKAFYYNTKDWKAKPNTVTVQNEYGVYVDDVTKGVKSNYAIYTNKGSNHFGDRVSIGAGHTWKPFAPLDIFISNYDGDNNWSPEEIAAAKKDLIVLDLQGAVKEKDSRVSISTSWRWNKVKYRAHSIDFGLFNGTAQTKPFMAFSVAPQQSFPSDKDMTIERMRITSEGNVGIGTTKPEAKLEVNGGSVRIVNDKQAELYLLSPGTTNVSSSIRTLNTKTNKGWFIAQGGGSLNLNPNDFTLYTYDNAVTNLNYINRFIINYKTGNVGIGTLSPDQKLHVVGNILASGTITPSDKRFKKGIGALNIGLASLSKLRPVSYYWNAKGKEQGGDTREHLGFIAQEIEKVLPNLVSTDKEGYKSVNYIEMIPVLTKAIQEQQKEIEELKALVKQLLTDKK